MLISTSPNGPHRQTAIIEMLKQCRVNGMMVLWDVPVTEVSEMPRVQAARATRAEMRPKERYFLG
jgi:TPP-dependent trihydroxycyclohexane-1,2-dione (THcHDO) dehydratase